MPVRRRSPRGRRRNDTCVWSWKEETTVCRIFSCGSSALQAEDPNGSLQDSLGRPTLIPRTDIRCERSSAGSQANKSQSAFARSASVGATGFPVVIGEGSHPFPFRTRKLSPLPPMVLRAKVRGRVGHCREYSSKGPMRKRRAFFCVGANREPANREPATRCIMTR